MILKKTGLWASVLAMVVLISDSPGAAQAAAEGVAVCIRTVIPSLFPFFLLSGYLTGALSRGKFTAGLARIFRSEPATGSILAAGLLGGYPSGAKLAQEGYVAGRISSTTADRLLAFCSQAGPSFLFGIVAAQFPSVLYAWLLWTVQILSAAAVAWVLPDSSHRAAKHEGSREKKQADPMRNALYSMAAVCGWVIVCSVVLHYLKIYVLGIFPEWTQVLLCGLIELTTGCLQLTSVEPLPLRFLLSAVMLNFGGLCVMLQTASVAKGLDFAKYIRGKCLQTVLAIGISGLIVGGIWVLLPVLFIFIRKILPIPRKRYSISQQVGV